MTDVTAQQSLRERKKARTRAAIREHALRLFREQGYLATTVEQIAAAAEVSPSTFFRYFPTKEDVVLQDDMDTRIADAVRRQPPGLSPLAAMRAAVRETWLSFGEQEWAQLRQAAALSMSVPEIRARSMNEFARTIDVVAEALADRTGRPAADFAIRVTAGALIGVMMSIMLPHHGDDDAGAGGAGRAPDAEASKPGDRDDDHAPGTEFGPGTWQLLDEALALLEAGLPLLSQVPPSCQVPLYPRLLYYLTRLRHSHAPPALSRACSAPACLRCSRVPPVLPRACSAPAVPPVLPRACSAPTMPPVLPRASGTPASLRPATREC